MVLDGLSPATTYDVVATGRGIPRFFAGRVRTLPVPGERLLCRIATVSDVHIGETHFGVMGRIHDALDQPDRKGSADGGPYPVRALRAAIDEAVAWGAELIVAKGDLTTRTVPAEVRDAGRLLSASPVPVEALLGNHDNELGVNIRAILEKEGLAVPWVPRARDLPGVRLVLVNTVQGDPRYHRGQLPPAMSRRVAQLAAGSPTRGLRGAAPSARAPPPPDRLPSGYPVRGKPPVPGRPGGGQARCLGDLRPPPPQPPLRLRPPRGERGGRHQGLPGRLGRLQGVRRRCGPGRTADSRPDVISWTEATRRAMNGQWHRWSPGGVNDRCFAVSWVSERH